MTMTRTFGGFAKRHAQHRVEALGQGPWERVIPADPAAVLGPDSTIIERYGQQEDPSRQAAQRKHGTGTCSRGLSR